MDIEKKPKFGRWLKQLSEAPKPKGNNLNVGNVSSKLVKTRKSKVWRISIKSGSRIDKMNMIDPDRMSREECEKVLIDKFGAGRLVEFKERES